MGWKFQRTLKFDISFSLEHFFISVAIFRQVASAPLTVMSNGSKKFQPRIINYMSYKHFSNRQGKFNKNVVSEKFW